MMPGHDPKALVQRLWDFCDVLRDDGLSYGDYLEQLTYLLFLKMADEQHELLGDKRVVPIEYDWQSLLSRSGAALEAHYSEILSELGAGDDMLGVVFRKARNRIQTPAKLEQLIKDFIDKHDWLSYDADLKGDAYEGLIEKTAQEGARGAGQYFTPRGLISAIVDVMLPRPDHRICDPACGTGGFFLGAYRSIIERFTPLEPDQVAHLRSGAFTGWEIADLPARLCAMNLLLHGIESPESDSPIHVDDALRADPGQRFDIVLTNPPFGRSSSDSYEREDFWATTRNKQLNFVQHVVSLLKVGGTAAVVVPDNVLFEAGAGETIPPPPAARLRGPHPAAPTDGHLLRAGREGQRAVLPPPRGSRAGMDKGAVGLRPAHQQALHPQAEPPEAGRPRRLRGLLQPRRPPPAPRVRTLQALPLRRPHRPRQGQPRPLLAPRREPRGHRQPPTPSRPSRRNSRRPPIRPNRNPSPHRGSRCLSRRALQPQHGNTSRRLRPVVPGP